MRVRDKSGEETPPPLPSIRLGEKDPLTASSSPGSIRTRRYRERQRNGKVYVRFEMTPEGVDRLVAQGWLDPGKQDDWRAVTQSFLDLGTSALWPEKMRA